MAPRHLSSPRRVYASMAPFLAPISSFQVHTPSRRYRWRFQDLSWLRRTWLRTIGKMRPFVRLAHQPLRSSGTYHINQWQYGIRAVWPSAVLLPESLASAQWRQDLEESQRMCDPTREAGQHGDGLGAGRVPSGCGRIQILDRHRSIVDRVESTRQSAAQQPLWLHPRGIHAVLPVNHGLSQTVGEKTSSALAEGCGHLQRDMHHTTPAFEW